MVGGYVGVNGIARRIYKGYVGINNIARKIKKIYVGVGGVARPCWESGKKITYYGTITPLSYARDYLSATTVGNYALFGGGDTGNADNNDTTDGYDTSLTRVSVSALQHDTNNIRNAATTVGNYALFGGGEASTFVNIWFISNMNKYVTAYDANLTRSYPSNLDDECSRLAATTVGDYALFGGGYEQSMPSTSVVYDWKYNVTAYNNSLTKSVPTRLSSEKAGLAATTVGNYAMFGGGIRDGVTSNTVDTYDTSLTKGTATALSVARDDLAATTVGDYALFGGGWNSGDVNTVDAYNASLTKVAVSPLSIARDKLTATTLGNYAMFGGGEGTNIVDIYDNRLTKQANMTLSSARYFLASTTVGNNALFGGGYTSSRSDAVDVFKLYEEA